MIKIALIFINKINGSEYPKPHRVMNRVIRNLGIRASDDPLVRVYALIFNVLNTN